MAVNIQTIKDIRNYLLEELQDQYPAAEINAMCNIIIEKLCNLSRIKQLSDPQHSVDLSITKKVKNICKGLIAGNPLQYILGETVFYNCKIYVDGNVLIPRPETEELVDLILKENRNYKGSIIDFGTGSGCIAIALAYNLPDAKILATDISGEALALALKNAHYNHVKINFVKSDLLTDMNPSFPQAGIIVSNPPYIRPSEKDLMHRNVYDFEPHDALFVPENDPLVFYRAILETSKKILSANGKIYFEINEAMGDEMKKLCESSGFINIQIIKDINGKERIVKGTRNG
jgi:release factor glutamine methyltransferase